MQTSTSSLNIATLMLIGMFALVILSLLTLAIYFFGGQSPFERNIKGRIEAAVNPAEVLTAHRQYNRFRLVFTLAMMVGFYVLLYRTAPAQTEQATQSFFAAVGVVVQQGREAVGDLLEELGIGNECECADPSRIGGNGP